MRRNTASGLRFSSVTYLFVRSLRKIRTFLVLLASPYFYFGITSNTIKIRRNTTSGLRFPSVTYLFVRSLRKIRAFLVLLASPYFYFGITS